MTPPRKHELRRRVRLHVAIGHPARSRPGEATSPSVSEPRNNPYAAWPSSEGFGVYLEVELAVQGSPDPITGYLVDIGAIDDVVRSLAVPPLQQMFSPTAPPNAGAATGPPAALPPTPASLLRLLLHTGSTRLGRPVATALIQLTPFYSLAMDAIRTDRVLLRQFFEFSASHRLHCPEFDDARNRELFGKCNNPNGHGHNYRVEVAVETPLDDRAVPSPGLKTIEAIVRERVIDRFDHKHLNSDVPEFRTRNPSVENITAAAYELLAASISSVGGRLRSVTVWETEKTCCTYPATSV